MRSLRIEKLKNLCTKIGSGATPKGGKESYKNHGIALIRSQNILMNEFSLDGLAYIDDPQASELKNVIVQTGDVLLNITGDSVARVCQAPEWILPARVNQHVAIVRPDSTILNSTYLRYFLASPKMQDFMLGLASSGATRPALTKVMIEDFDIPIPSMYIQNRIAETLNQLDQKIEINKKINATLESMAKTIFKEWFNDFGPVKAKAAGEKPFGMDDETAALFPDSFEESELGMIPKGWQTTTVGNICALEYGKALKEENRVQGTVDVWGSNSVVGTHNVEFVKGPGIVIGRKGNAGAVNWAFKNFWPIDTAFYIVPKQKLSLEYLFDVLQNINFKNLNSDSAVPGLNRDQALSVTVSIPKNSEVIEKYTRIRKHFKALIRSNLDEIAALKTTRDLLLPKLIAGEIQVSEVLGD